MIRYKVLSGCVRLLKWLLDRAELGLRKEINDYVVKPYAEEKMIRSNLAKTWEFNRRRLHDFQNAKNVEMRANCHGTYLVKRTR